MTNIIQNEEFQIFLSNNIKFLLKFTLRLWEIPIFIMESSTSQLIILTLTDDHPES